MSIRLVIAGIAAVIACIILWIWLGHDHAPVEALKQDAPVAPGAAINPEVESAPAAQVRKNIDSNKSPAQASRLKVPGSAEVRPPMVSETVPKDRKHLDDYLSRHGRSARSLLQAFRTSKNKDYLNEALERYPDDPLVLLHCVLYDTGPTEERKAMLKRLQKLLPDDAVPCYLLGEQLLQEGDTEAALALLMDGSLKPYANNYANEMISDAQEFLEASGVPPVDALAQASFNVELRLLTPMRHIVSMVQDIHTDISAKADQVETARTWAIVGSRLAQSMHSQMSQFLAENLMSVGIEKKFLSLLTPETELVAGGMTVAQRTKEIEDFTTLVRSFRLMSDAALALPAKEQQLFFKKVQEEGERSALLWLNGLGGNKQDGNPNNEIQPAN